MEPEVREFLKRIMYSVVLGFTWMMINSTFGIMFGFAFFEDGFTLGNGIFYVWFIASLAFILWLYVKLWKAPIPNSSSQEESTNT